MACKIRAYVKAVEATCGQGGLDDETAAWVEWAKKKSDWFDPTVAREDEDFGIREHELESERKILKERYW